MIRPERARVMLVKERRAAALRIAAPPIVPGRRRDVFKNRVVVRWAQRVIDYGNRHGVPHPERSQRPAPAGSTLARYRPGGFASRRVALGSPQRTREPRGA